MFEKLLSEVLNKVLGKFISNIDHKQLSVSLTSGKIKLENMKLKSNIFDAMPVPFKLVWGQIGVIDLQVPIWNLFSQPLIIEINHIFGIIRPKDFSQWDTNVEEQAYKEQTQSKLEEFEIFATQKQEIQKDPSSVDKLVQKIIDNIQVKVTNVYFRYEDQVTAANQGSGTFIIGVLLKEVALYSSEDDWQQGKGVVDSQKDITFKVGKIKGLSIYLDFVNEKEEKNVIQNELKLTQEIENKLINEEELNQDKKNEMFKQMIENELNKWKEQENKSHYFILDSFSLEIRAQINKNPMQNGKPQIELSILLGGQYKNMELNLLKNLSNIDQELEQIPQNIPKIQIKLQIRQPQIMRIMKLLEFIGYYNEFQSGSQSKFINRPLPQSLANEYINTYIDWKLISDDKKQIKVATKKKEELAIIEDKFPYQKMLVLRKLGVKMIEQKENFKQEEQNFQKQVQEIQNQKKSGFFTSKEKKEQNKKDIEEFKLKLSEEIKNKQSKEKSELENEMEKLTSQLSDFKIKFNNADFQKMPADYVRFKLRVQLPLFILSYINEYHSPLFSVYFTDQEVDLTKGGTFFSLQFIIQSFRIEDLWSGARAFPNIIETRQRYQRQSVDVLNADYQEKKALIFKFDTGKDVKIAPFRIIAENQTTLFIVVNWILIKEIIRSMSSAFKGEKLDFKFYKLQSQQLAVSYIKAGKELVEKMKKGEYDHHAVDLHVELKAPVVMLCDNIFYPQKQIIVVDTGNLKLVTTLIKHDNEINYKMFDKADQVFDRYECTLTKLQLSIMEKGLPDGFASYRQEEGNHVFKDFNALFNVYNAHDPFHSLFPTIEFVTIFKNIELEFGKEEVMYIIRIVYNLLEAIKVKEQKLIDQTIISKRKFKDSIQQKHSFISHMRKQLDQNQIKISDDDDDEFFDALEENYEDKEKREKKQRDKEVQSRIKSIQEEKQLAEQNKLEELRPSWRIYFELLFFGFELEYDKKGNLNINISVFKFTIYDTQQDEQIANPFRMILSSPLVEYQKKKFVQEEEEDSNIDIKQNQYLKITSPIPKIGSIIQKSLVYLPEFSNSNLVMFDKEKQQDEKYYDAEDQGHFVDEFSFMLKQIKGETSIYCQLTDIRLILSMSTIKKIVKIQIEITEVVKMLTDEKYNNRVRRLRIYEQLVKNMDQTYETDEYNFYRQVVINFYQHSGLNLKDFQDALKEGTSKLQELWDYPEREFQILSQYQMVNDIELNDVSEIEKPEEIQIEEIKKPITTRIEKKQSILIIEAKLNNLSIWIPLKPSDCKCQIASLSFISDFNYQSQTENEDLIDCEFNYFQPQQKDLFKKQTMLTPSRITLKMDKISRELEQSQKINLVLAIEPMHIKIGFNQIDFAYIFLAQVQNFVIKQYENQSADQDTLLNWKVIDDIEQDNEFFQTESKGQNYLDNLIKKKRRGNIKSKKKAPIVQQKKAEFKFPVKKPKIQSTTIKFVCEILTISLIEDSGKMQFEQPLINASLTNVQLYFKNYFKQDDAATFILKKMGVYQKLYPKKTKDQIYLNMTAGAKFQIYYYNTRNLAFEPMIEPWIAQMEQESKFKPKIVSLESQYMLNINLTYGMALTFRKIMNKLENSQLQAKLFIEEYLKSLEESDTEDILNKSRTSSVKSKLKINANQIGFIFQNFTGLNMRFCAHDFDLNQDLEYQYEENKEDMSINPQSGKPQRASQKELTLSRMYVLQAFDNEDIFKTYDEIYLHQREIKQRQSFGKVIDSLDDEPIKIDFKLDGIEKLAGIPIEGIGIFSYTAQMVQFKDINDVSSTMNSHNNNTTTSSTSNNRKLFGNVGSYFTTQKRQLTPMEQQKGKVSVLCNIKMEGLHKQVTLESQLLISNNCPKKLKIVFMEQNQSHSYVSPTKRTELEPGDVYRVPVSFFIHDPPLSIYLDTGTEHKIIVFKDFAQYFTSNQDLSKLTDKISSIIPLGQDDFISIDIQGYKCLPKNQTINPLQYLVSFNPPLMISNYNFAPLEIFDVDKNNTLAQVAPKCIKYITQIDPLKGKNNLKLIFYEQSQTPISCQLSHFTVEYKQDTIRSEKFEQIDQEEAKKQNPYYIQTEYRRNYFQDYSENDYNENFELRHKIVNFVSSTSLLLYPKYTIINKTMTDIICQDQIIRAFSNNYLKVSGDTKTVAFKIAGYKSSQAFAISTIGLAGSFEVDVDKVKLINIKQMPQQYVSQRIDFGLTIQAAPVPFNKTTLVQIVPRFVIVNKLNKAIVVRQKGLQQQILVKAGDKIPYNFEQKTSKYICIRGAESDEVFTDRLSLDKFQDIDNWSSSFPLEDIDDFQISYQELKKVQPQLEDDRDLFFSEMLQSQPQIWYEQDGQNNNKVFVRVIITTQDDATIFIVFTNPLFPEYEIHNKTEETIEICQVQAETIGQKMKINYKYSDLAVSKLQKIPAKLKVPYAWQDRIQNKMKLLVKIGNFEDVISLDKAKKLKDIETSSQFKYQIEVKVKGNSKQLKIKKVLDSRVIKGIKKVQNIIFNNQNGIINLMINLKGVGISFIDDLPREVMFLSIYNIYFNYQKWIESRTHTYIETSQKFQLHLKHLQIDNMTGESIPVILAPLKLLNKNLNVLKSQEEEKVAESEDHQQLLENTPFIQFNLQIIETKSTIGSINNMDQTMHAQDQLSSSMLEQSTYSIDTQQMNTSIGGVPNLQNDDSDKIISLKSFQVSIQEFLFKLDTVIVTSNVKFVEEILEILIKQRRFKPQLTTSDAFEKAKQMPKDKICTQLDALKPILSESKNIQSNKIFIEFVHLGAIKAIITIRLERKAFEIDIASPGRAFGVGNILQNFFASAATISNSPLQFKELIILDTFTSTNQFALQLTKNYTRQAVLQFYKFLGSSDLIGNPLGLVDKLGTGVFEFFSEPKKGLLQGPEQFVGGIGKGVKGLVSNVVGGGFESVSKISGSLYSVVKNAQGEQNIQLKKPDHVLDGIYQGVKGGAMELFGGVKGVFTKPVQGGQQKGAKGVIEGLGSGLLGALTAPISATLRIGSSITSGVAQSASNLGNDRVGVIDDNSQFARFRPPRYINLKNIVQPYNEEMALVSQLIADLKGGAYVNSSIKLFCSVPECKANGEIVKTKREKKGEEKYNDGGSLIIITDEHLLYVKVESEGKKKGHGVILFKSSLKSIKKCEVYKSQGTTKNNEDENSYYMIIQSQRNQSKIREYKFVSREYQKFEKIYDKLAMQFLIFVQIFNFRVPQIQGLDRVRKIEKKLDESSGKDRSCC